MKESILQKLETLQERYVEVGALLSEGEIISEKRYLVKLREKEVETNGFF